VATATAIENTPDYWMVVLLRALRRRDFPLVREAQRELRDRGLDIRIGHELTPPARKQRAKR
jgi:hypothetical protein